MVSTIFKTIDRQPAYMRVSSVIEEQIRKGRLKEGDLLPTESDMCEQFGVTRSTVREGIRRLEQSGLVARGAGKRMVVTHPKTTDVARAASRGLSLNGATFREVYEALEATYPSIARIAAERMTEETLAELEAIQVKIENGGPSTKDLVSDATLFIEVMTWSVNNRVLMTIVEALNMMSGESLRRVLDKVPGTRERIARAQARILKAFRARDPENAALGISKQIADLKRAYEQAGIDLDDPVI